MTQSMDDMLAMLQKYLIFDLMGHFGDVRFRDENNLCKENFEKRLKFISKFCIMLSQIGSSNRWAESRLD